MALVTNIRTARPVTELSPVIWAEPESKLWVGARDGEYAGMIEYAEGHFVCTGPTGEPLGSASDLTQAMSVVTSRRPQHRVTDAVLSNVALASAVIALSIAGVSLSMIAA